MKSGQFPAAMPFCALVDESGGLPAIALKER